MNLTRRQWLGIAAGLGLAGCAPVAARVRPRAAPEDFRPPRRAGDAGVRLYQRAAFGPRPGDVAAHSSAGHEATVDRLLAAREEEPLHLQMQLRRLDVFRLSPMELRDLNEDEVLRQLQQGALLRAVFGANPLLERMADFWSNHFNIYARKGWAAWRMAHDETEVVRKHALGDFPAMLAASARSPAMVAYLDGLQNVRGVPNENYARELLELHTLGVDGGYTQRDIQEIARCFTGWSIENRFLRPRGLFRFVPDSHDAGEKRVLGHTIPAGGGIEDGEAVIQIVANHPSTRARLARKLVQTFVGRPDAELETQVAEVYRTTGGNIRSMLRTILTSSQFERPEPILKRPLDYMVASLRALDADTDGGNPLQTHLLKMGQPLYQWPMPDGYPVESDAWAPAILPRWNYAFALAGGEIAGTRLGGEDLGPVETFGAVLGRRPGPEDRHLLQAMFAEPKLAAGVCLASPEAQWR